MATFTIPLWRVLELEQDPGNGYTIGLSTYPIPKDWPDDFRSSLNQKILRHYWNREIGTETISMFAWAVARRMHEVMPYYVQLYESQMLVLDPLSTVKLTTTRDDEATENVTRDSTGHETTGGSTDVTGTSTQDSTNTGTASQGSRAINSDFPQTHLADSEDYASSGADSHGTSTTTGTSHAEGGSTTGTTTTSTGDTTGTETAAGTTSTTGTSTTTGYQSAVVDLLARYRATFLNVDMLVIEALADCFLQVWDNGQEYLPAVRPLESSPRYRLDARL